MTALVIALGFAVLFQFVILRIKWNRGDYADVAVDITMLFILNAIFSGSILGVLSATAGSTLISLYLIYYPIKILRVDKTISTATRAEASMAKMAAQIDEWLK